jgi:hypothetical protein
MNPELKYACPLCAATEGEPCRRVPSGKKAERSHVSRIQLWNPRYKVENRALCCQCGNLRTVSANHSFRVDDPAATRDDDDRSYLCRPCTRSSETRTCRSTATTPR